MPKTKEQIASEMNEAGERARESLKNICADASSEDIALGQMQIVRWMQNNYEKAGYKRLCKILLQEMTD